MELFHFERRSQRSAAALGFGTADAFGAADHFDVSGSEQFENALVETKIAHGILNLSFFDVPNTISSKSGEERSPRVHAADVPETADEQSTLGGFNHVFDAHRRR